MKPTEQKIVELQNKLQTILANPLENCWVIRVNGFMGEYVGKGDILSAMMFATLDEAGAVANKHSTILTLADALCEEIISLRAKEKVDRLKELQYNSAIEYETIL